MKRTAPYWHPPTSERYITKGELAKLVFDEELTYDFALPEPWLARFDSEERERILCQCVWAYPPRSIFGECVNLLTGEVES